MSPTIGAAIVRMYNTILVSLLSFDLLTWIIVNMITASDKVKIAINFVITSISNFIMSGIRVY